MPGWQRNRSVRSARHNVLDHAWLWRGHISASTEKKPQRPEKQVSRVVRPKKLIVCLVMKSPSALFCDLSITAFSALPWGVPFMSLPRFFSCPRLDWNIQSLGWGITHCVDLRWSTKKNLTLAFPVKFLRVFIFQSVSIPDVGKSPPPPPLQGSNKADKERLLLTPPDPPIIPIYMKMSWSGSICELSATSCHINLFPESVRVATEEKRC